MPYRAPSPSRLLSGTAPFLLFDTAPLSSVSFSFPSTLPLFPCTCSPGTPHLSGTSSLSAPLRLPSTGPLRPPAPPPFRYCSAKTGPNGGPRFGPVWPNGGSVWPNERPRFNLHSVKQDRTEALRSVLFGLEGRGRWGPVPENRKGALGESMCRGVEKGLWERGRRRKGRRRCWIRGGDGGGIGRKKRWEQGCGEKKEE